MERPQDEVVNLPMVRSAAPPSNAIGHNYAARLRTMLCIAGRTMRPACLKAYVRSITWRISVVIRPVGDAIWSMMVKWLAPGISS